MKLLYTAFILLFTSVTPAAFGEGSCSAQGGMDCPTREPPPPHCPVGHFCEMRINLDKNGEMTILHGGVPIAVVPNAAVHWHPVIEKQLSDQKNFDGNGMLVELTNQNAPVLSKNERFRMIDPKAFNGLSVKDRTLNFDANPPKKK